VKSILDPDFKYRNSDNTNVAELFDRVKRRSPSPTRTFAGSVTDLHVPYVARPLRRLADQPVDAWNDRIGGRVVSIVMSLAAVFIVLGLCFGWFA